MERNKHYSPVVSIYLDTRRSKKQSDKETKEVKKYPVKLRIYFNYSTKLYPIGKDLSQEEFNRSYQAERPRDNFKDLKLELLAIELKATRIIDNLDPFTFEAFERLMFRNYGDSSNVFYHYDLYIQQLEKEGRPGTASNYDLSQKALHGFLKRDRINVPKALRFEEITVSFLKDFEKWMLGSGKSITTVGIYLRPLRSIYNTAIDLNDTTKDNYPFGKRKYVIPSGKKVKKALNKDSLKLLFNAHVMPGSEQEKAKDFFFFSYQCNGMNIKDIALLRVKNIGPNTITFVRQKTLNTTRANLSPINVPLTAFAKGIIEKYGNLQQSPNNYLFPILKEGMTAKEVLNATNNFTRFINQHIKKLAVQVGIDSNVSTYWARHSYTTNAIRSGASMEYIQESLGHQNLSTTMNYWSGFEDSIKKDIADKIMDF